MSKLSLSASIKHYNCLEDNSFNFLNRKYIFDDEVDWNYNGYGKLWTYNLTYFDYLNQISMDVEEGLNLIYDFIGKVNNIKDGLEPFPISLRGINWIKFLVCHNIEDTKINNSLYAQYYILLDNLEYHLLGNHLLENGFSLLFGAYYFQDDKLYIKAREILTEELNEQILDDGAHFELSPMYHQIMLYRMLDCINLIQNNRWKNKELYELFASKSETMLGWLNTITFNNGKIPLLNDSANYIAPTSEELNKYASRLNIKMNQLALKDCGYRKVINQNYEMIVDVGNIGPDYIPGHAHSDTFSFELHIDDKPLIVDTGTSTYEVNDRRKVERSTASHNTVEVEGMEQSEIWGAFRVASRAKIVDRVEKEGYITATHDGYKKTLGVLHQREFIYNDKSIKIVDTLSSNKRCKAVARLHFYPGVIIKKKGNNIICNGIHINFSTADIAIFDYLYAPEFNKTISSKVLEIEFEDKLEVEIEI